MKKTFFTLLTLLLTFTSEAQIEVNYLEILNNSNRFTYVGITYNPDYQLFNPDFDAIRKGLASLQQRYDANFKIISYEYQKLMNLTLINETNNTILNTRKKEVKKWADEYLQKFDLSNEVYTRNILDYITSVYTNESIKNELKTLQFISGYLNYIKTTNYQKGCLELEQKKINDFCKELKNYTNYQLSEDAFTLFKEFDNKRIQILRGKNENTRSEILSRYSAKFSYNPISNGWQTVYYISVSPLKETTDEFSAYYRAGTMKIYVSNNRVTMYLNRDGSASEIDISVPIVKNKVDILIPDILCDGKSIKVPLTLYFLD